MMSNIDAPMASRTSTTVTFSGRWLVNRRGLPPTALALTKTLLLSNRARQVLDATALTAWNLSKRSRRRKSLGRCSASALHTVLSAFLEWPCALAEATRRLSSRAKSAPKLGAFRRNYVIRSPIFPRHIAQAFSSCKVKRA